MHEHYCNTCDNIYRADHNNNNNNNNTRADHDNNVDNCRADHNSSTNNTRASDFKSTQHHKTKDNQNCCSEDHEILCRDPRGRESKLGSRIDQVVEERQLSRFSRLKAQD